jgi:imidazolonepropionase-like amidohydrolase
MERKKLKVIRCGRIIDGKGGKPTENAIIVIEGPKIACIGEETEVDLPSRCEEIDCSKMTVLPGLIDAHLHLALGEGESYEEMFQWPDSLQLISGVVNSQLTLEAGITTARDCGARNRVGLDLREAARRNLFPAPRLLVCGRPITITGGHFHFCNEEADGYEGVRLATRRLIKEGVDFIKIMASGGGTRGTKRELSSYTLKELKGAVDEAHRNRKIVSAHCHATQAISNAVEAGVDIIEHCTFIEPDGEEVKHVFREDIAAEIVRKGIYVDNVLIALPDRRRLEWCVENFTRLMRAGAKILAGTDGLGLFKTTNIALILEMMVRCGASPIDAIISATKLSAEALRIDRFVGTLENGKEADILAVEGKPIEDIRVLRKPKLVIKGGAIMPPSGRVEAIIENEKLSQEVCTILDEFGVR